MTDGRGWREQTKSGLRLALSVVGVLITLGILTKGLLLVGSGTRRGVVEGAATIFLTCVLAFVTTSRWAKWFFGVCCLIVLRAGLMSIFERTISAPSVVAPRVFFLEVSGLFALMALLSYRFVNSRPSQLDSLCLVGALVAAAYSLVSNSVSGLLVAILFLGMGYAFRHRQTG